MTAEPSLQCLSPRALGPLTFLADLDPLPLVEPTEAARFLGIERHSLACYRSLDDGPPYYKFGRWIRYARADLASWRDRMPITDIAHALEPRGAGLVSPALAARYLTVTKSCLANYRLEGVGPRYCRLGRSVQYPVDELQHWAQRQRHLAGAMSRER
jgi:hypothetical protein